METILDYKGCEIRITEHTQMVGDVRHTHFAWRSVHYGKEIANGEAMDKGTAYQLACDASEVHLSDPYRFQINFVDWATAESGDVVTKDGEVLGTWRADENGHASFLPTGEDEALFFDVFLGNLARRIAEWHEGSE